MKNISIQTTIDENAGHFEQQLFNQLQNRQFLSITRAGNQVRIFFWDRDMRVPKKYKSDEEKERDKQKRAEKKRMLEEMDADLRKEYEDEDTMRSLRRARQMVHDYVNINLTAWDEKPIFLTLTFHDPDNTLAIDDAITAYTSFIQKLSYRLPFKAQYVCVPEFQKRGTPHFHVVFFNLPFIFVDDMVRKKLKRKKSEYDFNWTDIWEHGDVNIKLIKNEYHTNQGNYVSNGCARYMTKYLSKDFMDERLYGKRKYYKSNKIYKPFKMFAEIDGAVINNLYIKLLTTFDLCGNLKTTRFVTDRDFASIEASETDFNMDKIKTMSGVKLSGLDI